MVGLQQCAVSGEHGCGVAPAKAGSPHSLQGSGDGDQAEGSGFFQSEVAPAARGREQVRQSGCPQSGWQHPALISLIRAFSREQELS